MKTYRIYKIDPLPVNFLPCKFVIRDENNMYQYKVLIQKDKFITGNLIL